MDCGVHEDMRGQHVAICFRHLVGPGGQMEVFVGDKCLCPLSHCSGLALSFKWQCPQAFTLPGGSTRDPLARDTSTLSTRPSVVPVETVESLELSVR